MPAVTAQDIEIAVAAHFDYRRNLIVPNVHWGLGLPYEADLVVLRPSNWAIEVEIKVSGSDIRADLKKLRQHDSALFRELYFAVPEALVEHPAIPEHAGILSFSRTEDGHPRLKVLRVPKRRPGARKWNQQTRETLYRLAAMRTWTLKRHLAARTGGAA